ncbi:hypothetical protein NPIL_129371, partial [Nephila pilipes]
IATNAQLFPPINPTLISLRKLTPTCDYVNRAERPNTLELNALHINPISSSTSDRSFKPQPGEIQKQKSEERIHSYVKLTSARTETWPHILTQPPRA